VAARDVLHDLPVLPVLAATSAVPSEGAIR
jgi:hypothetical protein